MAKTKQNKTTQFPTEEINITIGTTTQVVKIRTQIPYASFLDAVNGCVEGIMENGFNSAVAEYHYNATLISVFTEIEDLSPDNILNYVYRSDLLDILGQKSKQACSFYQAVQSQLEHERSKSALDTLLINLNDKINKIDIAAFNAVTKKLADMDLTGMDGSAIVKAISESVKTVAEQPKKRGRPATAK